MLLDGAFAAGSSVLWLSTQGDHQSYLRDLSRVTAPPGKTTGSSTRQETSSDMVEFQWHDFIRQLILADEHADPQFGAKPTVSVALTAKTAVNITGYFAVA